MILLFIGWGWPGRTRNPTGRSQDMAVSKDIDDFCGTLKARVATAVANAVAAKQAEVDNLQGQLDALKAGVQTDHADEVAALGAALDEAAPPAAPV